MHMESTRQKHAALLSCAIVIWYSLLTAALRWDGILGCIVCAKAVPQSCACAIVIWYSLLTAALRWDGILGCIVCAKAVPQSCAAGIWRGILGEDMFTPSLQGL